MKGLLNKTHLHSLAEEVRNGWSLPFFVLMENAAFMFALSLGNLSDPQAEPFSICLHSELIQILVSCDVLLSSSYTIYSPFSFSTQYLFFHDFFNVPPAMKNYIYN